MPLERARILHVNVNCSSLERSRDFYTALGLTNGVRTAPEAPQPGDAFGLHEAQWDAWILCGDRGWDGALLDLLEWKRPTPTGAPPAQLYECGFQRVGMNVPDLDAALTAAIRAGGLAWSEPFTHDNSDGSAIRLATVSDPDGTAIELVEAGAPAISFVAVTCRDLERSLAVYRDLGFTEVARFTSVSEHAAHLHVDGRVEMQEVVLAPPGGGDALLILVGFVEPAPSRGAPRPANARGIWRVAFGVDDIDAGAAALDAAGAARLSAPVQMAMGPGLPRLRFVCAAGPDGEILECIENPAGA